MGRYSSKEEYHGSSSAARLWGTRLNPEPSSDIQSKALEGYLSILHQERYQYSVLSLRVSVSGSECSCSVSMQLDCSRTLSVSGCRHGRGAEVTTTIPRDHMGPAVPHLTPISLFLYAHGYRSPCSIQAECMITITNRML